MGWNSRNRYLLRGCSLLVSILAAITFYKKYRYEFYRNFQEQKILLYSEESFYFSFFNDIIKTDTYAEGIKLLYNDNRSEYPDTINAIKRFNIYPEIILGTLWRFLNLTKYFSTPFNFYCYAAILSQGASVGVLFHFATCLGKSFLSGLIFIILFFSCDRHKLIIRLSAFSLRENFASVYMWSNIFILFLILKAKKNYFMNYVGLFFSSLCFFLCWQFSVFVSLTHLVCLFAVELIGYPITEKINYIILTFICSYTVSATACFFSSYFLTTYFPYVLVSIGITNVFYTHLEKNKTKQNKTVPTELDNNKTNTNTNTNTNTKTDKSKNEKDYQKEHKEGKQLGTCGGTEEETVTDMTNPNTKTSANTNTNTNTKINKGTTTNQAKNRCKTTNEKNEEPALISESFKNKKNNEAIKEAIKEAKKETEPVTEPVTEQLTEQLTEKVTEKVTEQLTEKVTGQPTESETDATVVNKSSKKTQQIRNILSTQKKETNIYFFETSEEYKKKGNFSIKRALKKGSVSLIIFCLLRLVVSGKKKQDSHVFDLLKVRLKLMEHNFDSMIYSMGSEFNPLSKSMLDMVLQSALCEYFVIALIITCLFYTNYITCCIRNLKQSKGKETTKSGSKDNKKRKENNMKIDSKQNICTWFVRPHFIFLIFHIFLNIFLMMIIARLRVLALPLMCLYSGIIGSPNCLYDLFKFMKLAFFISDHNVTANKSKKRKGIFFVLVHLICILAIIYPWMKYFPFHEYNSLIDRDSSSLEKNMDLLQWLKNNINEREVLMADMPTSSFLRSGSNYRLILHPHYEDYNLRKRVQDFYMFSACPPFSDVKEYFYKKYKARYFINNIYRCALSGSEINAFSVADKIDTDYARCPSKYSMRFCSRVLYDTKNYKTLFRNGKYSVIYFLPTTSPDNTPYGHYSEQMYSNLKYFIPWINECIKTDNKCVAHIQEVAFMNKDVLKRDIVSSVLHSFVETEFNNINDVEVLYHLAEYFDFDAKDPKKANVYYKKCVDLIIRRDDNSSPNTPSSYVVSNSYNNVTERYNILWTEKPVSLSRRMSIIVAYIYFLIETKLNKIEKDFHILFFYLNTLVDAALYAMEYGYYYLHRVFDSSHTEERNPLEKDQQQKQHQEKQEEKQHQEKKNDGSNKKLEITETLVKENVEEFDTHKMVDILCNTSNYVYHIRNKNPQFIFIYKKFWSLIKKISYLNECVLKNFKKFEKRNITYWDYFRFFYLER